MALGLMGPTAGTGQREEATLGLYDYRARWYDPVLGRFIQPDSIVPEPGNPQSLNRYTYVLNNPLRYADPSGYDPLDENWRNAFAEAHPQRSIGWEDVLIRLYSIAYPDEYDESVFYDREGNLIAGSVEQVFGNMAPVPETRTWGTLPAALQSMSRWYVEPFEREMFVRDIGTLFGGLKDRIEEQSGLQAAVLARPLPSHPWLALRREGLDPSWTGPRDWDANVHHWAWALTLGATCTGSVGNTLNFGREVIGWTRGCIGGDCSFESIWNTYSDMVIGSAGARLGWSYRVFGIRAPEVNYWFFM